MKKTSKTIFIATFIIVLLIILGFLFFSNQKKEGGDTDPNQNKPFNPFGLGGDLTPDNGNNIQTGGSWINEAQVGESSRFYKITDFAVAGARFFEDIRTYTETTGDDYTSIEISTPVGESANQTTTQSEPKKTETKTETFPALRYVEKSTGHIYQMDLDSKKVIKVSNSTIPGVYEAIIDSLAKTFIYRYVSVGDKSITSYVATIGETKGSFLPVDIVDISLSPDKNKYFFIAKNLNGVVGATGSFSDNKKVQVFNSAFSEWLSQWINEQKIFLTTKPSWSVDGSLFSLNTSNGVLTKVFGGIKGLTTLSNNSGTSILYGASLEVGPKLWIFNEKEHTTNDLNTYGLPEKCVWSNDNVNVYCAVPNTVVGIQYPDSWYQGLVSFDDYFVKINTENLNKVTLANSVTEIPVDATHLFLDKEENTLFFVNKKDSTLWSLDLQ
ncbi:MAG: hypothetical protein PHT84_01760 [Candidatus Pacebacteria bacterium]|nr:hypothetical protein [Candidatus Paceibacterota bacterium]